jgi:hypothetical protein
MARRLVALRLDMRRKRADDGYNRREIQIFKLRSIPAEEKVVPTPPLFANPCHGWLVTRFEFGELICGIRAARRLVENGIDLLTVEPP